MQTIMATRMMTWKDVQNKAQGLMVDPIYRNQETQILYDANSNLVKAKYARYSDYIKIHVLKWTPVDTPEGLLSARRTRGSYMKRLTTNTFPYHLEPGITHMVLWSIKPLTPVEMHKAIRCKAFHDTEDPTVADAEKDIDNGAYEAFVNRVEHQSILDLWHAHVFVRRR